MVLYTASVRSQLLQKVDSLQSQLPPSLVLVLALSWLSFVGWLALHISLTWRRHRSGVIEAKWLTAAERFASLCSIAYIGFAVGVRIFAVDVGFGDSSRISAALSTIILALPLLGTSAAVVLVALLPLVWTRHFGPLWEQVTLSWLALCALLTSAIFYYWNFPG